MKSAIQSDTCSSRVDCSVVIPVYNRKDTVPRAIESVLAQTVSPREIIVVDDGSTDGVADLIASKFPDVKQFVQSNQGVSAARNRGIDESLGQWIAFLDSDDEWLPTKLEAQFAYLQTHPQISVCHCDEIWIRNHVRVNPRQRHRKQGGWIYLNCLPLCVISPSAVLIHRRVFETVGYFDESFLVCEDYDMWLRATHKYEVGFVDQPLLIKYGGHSDQLSKTYPAMDRYRIMALIKSLEYNPLTVKQRTKTLEMLIKKIKIYLNGAIKREKQSEVTAYRKMLDRYQTELETL